MLKIGLLINPVAGLGGTVALKGSDGADIQVLARDRGGQPRGASRARRMLLALGDAAGRVRWLTWGGDMGEALLQALEIPAQVLGGPVGSRSTPLCAQDTRDAAVAMCREGADLLVFCGGDGTARDLLDAVGQSLPVLGVPAGVKMHSGVFATTPESAAKILVSLIAGGLVRASLGEVRDLDEAALRDGAVRPRFYGELAVPEAGGFLQRTKESGRENEALALEEIVAEVVARIGDVTGPVVLGPGGSLAAVKEALGMEATLIGFDVLENGVQIGRDVDAAWLERYLSAPAPKNSRSSAMGPVLVLSFTRHQGFLLGRGNQQLTPAVLRLIPRRNLWVVGTRSKLLSLDGRPLIIDTDDPELDAAWSGLVQIIAGYDDRLWYQVASHA
jgi:predicted polyphosphate/ATP-dependent NAD kinase